jgi:hypothetical protein
MPSTELVFLSELVVEPSGPFGAAALDVHYCKMKWTILYVRLSHV